MKRVIRDRSRYYHEVAYNALTEINPTRLKLIAAVAIEFTSLEAQIDVVLRDLLRLDWDETDVTSRINGFDGKVAIIKSVTAASPTLSGEPAKLVASTLGEIGTLKTYRDAVIHANIHEPKATMAQTSIKHGKPYEVDISVKTLRALLGRIRGFQMEMSAVFSVTSHHFTEVDLESDNYKDASEVINGRYPQLHLRQLRKRQTMRKSLPVIPKLQEELPSHQPKAKKPHIQERQPGESETQTPA